MPKGMEVYLDLSRVYKFPDYARENIGSGTVHRPPDVSGFLKQVVAELRGRYGDYLADAVEEEITKVVGPLTTAALIAPMQEGLPIPVPVRDAYRVTPLGWTLPVLPAQRLATVTLYLTLGEDTFLGTATGRRKLGQLASRQSGTESGLSRSGRWTFDFPRGWLRVLAPFRAADAGSQPGHHPPSLRPGTLNSQWWNLVYSLWGDTDRSVSQAEWTEHSTGIVFHANDPGPALFSVAAGLSAEITVESAPAAFFDIATLGSFQGQTTIPVPLQWLNTPLVLKYDPRRLALADKPDGRQAVGPLMRELDARLPPPGTEAAGTEAAGTVLESVLVAPRDPPSHPAGPRIQPWEAGRTLAELHPGILLDTSRLDGAVVEVYGGLRPLRRLALPLVLRVPAERQVPGWSAAAAWDAFGTWFANHVAKAPPGSSWLHPRSDLTRQLAVIISSAFLADRFIQLVTSGVRTPFRLPGRLYYTPASLEIYAKITDIVEGLSTHEAMSKDFTGRASTRRWRDAEHRRIHALRLVPGGQSAAQPAAGLSERPRRPLRRRLHGLGRRFGDPAVPDRPGTRPEDHRPGPHPADPDGQLEGGHPPGQSHRLVQPRVLPPRPLRVRRAGANTEDHHLGTERAQGRHPQQPATQPTGRPRRNRRQAPEHPHPARPRTHTDRHRRPLAGRGQHRGRVGQRRRAHACARPGSVGRDGRDGRGGGGQRGRGGRRRTGCGPRGQPRARPRRPDSRRLAGLRRRGP